MLHTTPTTRRRCPLFPALLIGIAGFAVAPATVAQDGLGSGDALGSGNALDASPLEGSGGYNPVTRDWNSEIAFRNAIVTGNVGGGREFRGNLGYSGVGDFRGALGSDLIYNFQRDSFYSGLAARKVRGIEATSLQLQGPMAGLRSGFGGLSGGLIISRPGAGTSAGDVSQSSTTPQNQLNDLLAFDRVNTTLRSTSAFTVRDATRPRVVGAATDGTGSYYLAASPLGGIDALSPLDPALVSGRSYSPEQFDFDPRIAVPGFREQAMRDQQLRDDLDDAEMIAERMPGHRRILSDLRERAIERGLISRESVGESPEADPRRPSSGTEPSPERPGLQFPDLEPAAPGADLGAEAAGRSLGPDDGLRASPDHLDQLLRGFSRELGSEPGTLGPRATDGPGVTPPGLGPTPLRRAADPASSDPGTVDEIMSDRRMERMISLLREQNTTIDRIAPAEDGSLYAQHMRAGERLLADGMWFIAEERFVAALTSRPGDAMAATGRAHAQIGAGLYLSAAVNLADLLRAYPELATVRYQPELLPGAERLGRIREQLRSRSVNDDTNARHAGFILAYLGFQTGRPGDIREGFAVVERVNEALNHEPDPLMAVLRELWAHHDGEDQRQAP